MGYRNWRDGYTTRGTPKELTRRLGQAAELFVRRHFLLSGLDVFPSDNPQGIHDLVVQVKDEFLSVQVKMGRVHPRTHTLTANQGRLKVKSDLFVIVDSNATRLRILPGRRPVPPELLT